MFKLKCLLAAACLVSSSLVSAKANVCLTEDAIKNGAGASRTKMYSLMVQGSSDASRGITIVDDKDWGNEEMLANYGAMNESLFAAEAKVSKTSTGYPLYGQYIERYQFNGIFKIGYRYNAIECRRQIILGRQIRDSKNAKTGSFNGWTAVEICNPGIAGLFVKAKAALAPKGGMPTIHHFLGFVKAIHDLGKLDDATFKQINKNLAMTPGQAKVVSYFKDADGDILPRFAVKIKKFYYQETGVNCNMVIDHEDEAANYAGLMSSYKDDYSWELSLTPDTPSDLNLWYWDLTTMKPGDKVGTKYNYIDVMSMSHLNTGGSGN